MITKENQGSYLPATGWLDEAKTAYEGPGFVFLLVLTLVGLALRLFKLNEQSLWVDEMMTWEMVRPGAGLIFWQQTLDSIQGPLYQAVIWPLLRWQDSGLMLRLPAAVAGVVSIPVFGLVASRLFGKQSARFATIFWVINPFHIWYCQEGRGYSFLILFVLLAGYLFLRMSENGPTVKLALAFGLACAAGVWSNMSALFFWSAMVVTCLVAGRGQTKGQWLLWTLAFSLALVSVTPWILKAMGIWAVDRMVPGTETGVQLRGETTFSVIALPYTIFTFFFGYSWGPSLRELHSPDRLGVLRPFLPLLAVGGIPLGIGLVHGYWKARGQRILLAAWIMIPMVILFFLAVRNVKPWNPRYVVVILPWLLMLAAHGVSKLPRKPGVILALMMSTLTLFSLGNHYFRPHYHKADIRSAASWLQENNESANTMLVPVVTTVFNYYYGGAGKVVDTFGHPKIQNAAEAEVFVQNLINNEGTIWIFLAREWFFDPNDRVLVALARNGDLQLKHEDSGVRIFEWRHKHFEGGVRGAE